MSYECKVVVASVQLETDPNEKGRNPDVFLDSWEI